MSDSVFDSFIEEYEDACSRGVSLSGESRDHFAQERIRYTAEFCARSSVRRVLDFGCGLGHTTPYLSELFPAATVAGVDNSTRAIEWARQRYGSERIVFANELSTTDEGAFDLVYSNGTFHHIPPAERPPIVQQILRSLRPNGTFALWENNPWNPGTRLVMRRIPFDRDAQTLSYLETKKLLRAAGFDIAGTSFHFYFPAWLKPFRALEGALTEVPFGAQYCVRGRRPIPPST